MKELEWFIDKTYDELDDSKEYREKGVKMKDMGNLKSAEILFDLSAQELNHASDRLHTIIVMLINEEKKALADQKIEVPEYMTYKWNKEHNEIIDCVSEARYALEQARK